MKKIKVIGLSMAFLLFSGSVLAQQCREFDDVRQTCLDSISGGLSDVFSSDDEKERADSAGDATNSCTDCASQYFSGTVDDIEEDLD